MTGGGALTFRGVGKTYADGTRAVEDLNLTVSAGELMVLVGPSGCGKTSALRMVAGLEEITEGTILLDERPLNDVAPERRGIAMVFQNYALFPHLNAYDNIAFGLKVRRTPKREIEERVRAVARPLGLDGLLEKKPKHLSGGQRQRVAMGRAIVRDPMVLLMDEPLSNLDAKLRVDMRTEISRIQRQVGSTALYVTHDQVEALTLGDRIAVMRDGVLQQVGTPREIFESPDNLFVAGFIGSPTMNLLETVVLDVDGAIACRVGNHSFDLAPAGPARVDALRAYVGRTIGLGARPEQVLGATSAIAGLADEPVLGGEVVATELLGSDALVHVQLPAQAVDTAEVREIAADLPPALEGPLAEAAAGTVLVARLEAAQLPRLGDHIGIRLDVARLHFFDLDTGQAIGRFPDATFDAPRGAHSARAVGES
jgi:multiple sugar transport system ATP-binding protein